MESSHNNNNSINGKPLPLQPRINNNHKNFPWTSFVASTWPTPKDEAELRRQLKEGKFRLDVLWRDANSKKREREFPPPEHFVGRRRGYDTRLNTRVPLKKPGNRRREEGSISLWDDALGGEKEKRVTFASLPVAEDGFLEASQKGFGKEMDAVAEMERGLHWHLLLKAGRRPGSIVGWGLGFDFKEALRYLDTLDIFGFDLRRSNAVALGQGSREEEEEEEGCEWIDVTSSSTAGTPDGFEVVREWGLWLHLDCCGRDGLVGVGADAVPRDTTVRVFRRQSIRMVAAESRILDERAGYGVWLREHGRGNPFLRRPFSPKLEVEKEGEVEEEEENGQTSTPSNPPRINPLTHPQRTRPIKTATKRLVGRATIRPGEKGKEKIKDTASKKCPSIDYTKQMPKIILGFQPPAIKHSLEVSNSTIKNTTFEDWVSILWFNPLFGSFIDFLAL